MAQYTIQPDDTLYSIARKYSLSFDDLMRMNPQITDANQINIGEVIEVPEPTSVPNPAKVEEDCPWLDIAIQEMERGVKEIAGAADNPRIVEYHQSTSGQATDDETPWCSAFVNWCIQKTGIQGTDSALSSSWRTWGQTLKTPRRGCIVCFQGHVGFFHSEQGNKIMLLGGNQTNQVKITPYSKSKVLTYRWPQN